VTVRRLLVAVALAAPFVFWAAPASAQCAMCQTALLNSAEGRGISAEFNHAILVMLFAPYLVFAAVGGVLLRHRIAAALRRGRRDLRARLTPAFVPRVH
jgi:hypothetical protein